MRKRQSAGKMVTPTAVISAAVFWLGAQVSFCWNNITATLICLLLLALLLDYVMFRKRSSRFPPGPTPLPFLGNLLLFDFKNPYATIQNVSNSQTRFKWLIRLWNGRSCLGWVLSSIATATGETTAKLYFLCNSSVKVAPVHSKYLTIY